MDADFKCTTPKRGQWQTFNDDEEEEGKPLLLSALPTSSDDDDDFEFQVLAGGGLHPAAAADMCCADQVFRNGRILPLHPAARGLLSSRSEDCVGRCSTTTTVSTGRPDTSWSNSGGSSSSSNCVSRSHSSSSSSAYSNNFYAHPSPKPQLQHARRATAARRRSASSAPRGWGFLRLGLIRAPPPQAELRELWPRRSLSGHFVGLKSHAADAAKLVSSSSGSSSTSSSRRFDVEKKVTRLVGLGFNCKTSLDAVEPSPLSSKGKGETQKKKTTTTEEEEKLRRSESVSRSRIFEWLEELRIAKFTATRDGDGGH
ncbi:uncharacterized protein LOC122041697 [Zingiber officinale]|uniref:Uncharacterized protein n=1 Tax=Zingiber officinale TaxID=94328 RepID=A0A8J5HWN6_ZINOF|nr:uncharacterized protein LOC122041697 [Zingiber officinale]KAG6533267.1 hypothetical protein ZIOFF_007133 [Zingiber officinale]